MPVSYRKNRSTLTEWPSTKNRFTINSQIWSGAKSKIYNQLNDALAILHFDLICLQETWFDEKICDSEIIESTAFKDRYNFINSKISGGGVAMPLQK